MAFFDKLLEVNSVLLALFGIGLFGFGKILINTFKSKETERELRQKQVDDRLQGLEQANLAILHNKIYRQCGDHLIQGYISIDDLDDLDYLFRAYKTLGGNGTGETLYNEVKALDKQIRRNDVK